MQSLWSVTAQPPAFEPLDGDTQTDVLVIGGGIAGILCAYHLRRAGVNCLLVEADRICGGITKDTTAKITVQHGLIYDSIIRRFGIDAARLYLKAQTEALEAYRALCRTIPCDFSEQDAFVYARDSKGRKKIEREAAALARLGYPAAYEEHVDLPFPVTGAVRMARQAQFHPLKFLYAIASDLPIREHTRVLEFRPDGVVTDRGTIRADRIIVATHFPMLNKHGAYYLKLYQHRSYVLALENAPDGAGMYVDEAKDGLSVRRYNGLLLLGGGGHRTGKRGGGWQELEKVAAQYYPEARPVAKWATQDCMSLDGLPYIGRYARSVSHLFVATGFNKWGMTSSMVAARLLTDLVQGKTNPAAAVFNPSRRILRPQLAVNAVEAVFNLLTPTVPRCPHMGCALKYNPSEHSWDCPCHGSRFTEAGKLIDNPATGDRK